VQTSRASVALVW